MSKALGGKEMKRIVMFFMSTVTAIVLLFGYHTSTSSKAVGGQTSIAAPAAATTASSASGSSGRTSETTSTTTAAATSAASTVTGDVAQTRWGPVQVQLSVQGGKITNVTLVQYPNGNDRDQEINATALPILVQETVSAQSAKIDMVSGATVTSDGYVSSLQSALDKAGL
jgi:uncharacterized protein with FMN-binding domain